MNWNQALFPSLKRRGGCAIKKMSRSNLSSREVVSSAKSSGLKSFAELTTPSAALRRLCAFLLMPQPPLLFKEGNVSALKQSVNSFTRSKAGADNNVMSSRARIIEAVKNLDLESTKALVKANPSLI